MRVILFIMYDGVMLLLCNYYVRMREFIFIRVVIGYSSDVSQLNKSTPSR